MTVVTVRPDDSLHAFASVTGEATLHEALADDLDSSYGDTNVNPGESLAAVSFPDPSQPAGSVLKEARVRIRAALGLLGGQVYGINAAGVDLPPFSGSFLTPTTWTLGIVPLSALPDSVNVIFTMASHDVGGAARLYELYFDAVFVEQPVVEVTAPTGTLDETNLPSAAWLDTLDAVGGAQTHFEVKVFDTATYSGMGFDPDTDDPATTSGVVSADTRAWQATERLDDDDYRLYVRVAQTVNGEQHWSEWDYSEFEIDVPNPGTPTLSVSADGADGLIAIDLTGTAGDVSTDSFQVQRSVDGGTTWADIRTELGRGLTAGDIDDHEVPNGTEATYRARALHDFGGGFVSASPWSSTDADTWTSAAYFLKHATQPSLNAAFELRSPASGGVSAEARQTVHQALGATKGVAITDTRLADAGSIAIKCETSEEADALKALVDTLDPLLLQAPPEHGEPERWLALADHFRERFIDMSAVVGTWQELPWTEVEAPTGNLAE